MRKLLIPLIVAAIAAMLFGSVVIKEGMWWEYTPNNSYIVYQAPDFVVKASELKVAVLGKLNILNRDFYVTAYIYSGSWGKFVRMALLDPETFYSMPNTSVARLKALGKVKVTEISFPLSLGKEWEVVSGVRAKVIDKEEINVQGESLAGWVIEYTGGVNRKVLFCDRIGMYAWIKSGVNDLKLQKYGIADTKKLISEVEDAFYSMIKVAPYSALSALDILENFSLTKDFAEKLKEETMNSLRSSSSCFDTSKVKPMLTSDAPTSCMTECASYCYTNYILCVMGCSYFDPYCAFQCKENYELCKKRCCDICGTPCITSPSPQPDEELDETY